MPLKLSSTIPKVLIAVNFLLRLTQVRCYIFLQVFTKLPDMQLVIQTRKMVFLFFEPMMVTICGMWMKNFTYLISMVWKANITCEILGGKC